MTTTKPTIGSAIDSINAALTPFERREQLIIISTVCSHLELSHKVGGEHTSALHSNNSEGSRTGVPTQTLNKANSIGLDIRTLKEQKQPDSARQMACIVAYYLQEHVPEEEKKNTVGVSDLEKYFKQAGFKLPLKMAQVLVDSKSAGYFEAVSRGEYKLTRVGYNLVTHSMPRSSKGQ